MSKTIALRPLVMSEKAYAQSANRVYVFKVDGDVNKHDVARAVESQFDVKVTNVNIANIPGKAKRIISASGKRMKNAQGKRADISKAYVTLAEGNSLPFYEAIEEAAAEAEVAETKAKKADVKEAKPARRGILRGKKDDKKEGDK